MTRAQLLAAAATVARMPQSIGEMDPAAVVWVAHMNFGAAVHQSTDREHAACGAQIMRWPVLAGQMQRLSGQLCRRCWPTNDLRPTVGRGGEEV